MTYTGIFSQTAAEKYGSVIYATETGEAEVTTVVTNPETFAETYLFPDAAVVGEVTRYLRKGRTGSAPPLEMRERIDLEMPRPWLR